MPIPFTFGNPARRNRNGVTLTITLMLTALASISSLLMFRTLLDHQRINERRHDLLDAFYIAEAGVSQVIHWGNFPADYSPDAGLFDHLDPTTFEQDVVNDGGQAVEGGGAVANDNFDILDNQGTLFPALDTALSGGSFLIPDSMLGQFTSHYNYRGGPGEGDRNAPSRRG